MQFLAKVPRFASRIAGPNNNGVCHKGDEGPPPVCMYDCVNYCSDFTENFAGDMCELSTCITSSGCMEDCTAEETLSFNGMAYFCGAPAGCEDFFHMGGPDNGNLSTDENSHSQPEYFSFHPVYPNPFNPTTEIGFSLELAGFVSISLYDVTGKWRETILQNEFQNAGSYIITWNGSEYPSGIYFIYLQVGKQVGVQKITLLK